MKRMRIAVSMVLVSAFLLVCLSIAADYQYVASQKSNKYHLSGCAWAAKIKPENLVTFKTAKDALAAGYVPCKVCAPPTTDEQPVEKRPDEKN